MDRKSWGLSVGAVFFHGIFLALSFLLMPEYGDALLIAGMVAGGAFFLLWGIVGWRARRILPPFLFFCRRGGLADRFECTGGCVGGLRMVCGASSDVLHPAAGGAGAGGGSGVGGDLGDPETKREEEGLTGTIDCDVRTI